MIVRKALVYFVNHSTNQKVRSVLLFATQRTMNCKHSPPPASKSNVVQSLKTERQACQRPVLLTELAVHTGDPNPTAKAMKPKGNRARHSRYWFGRFPILEINTTARALKTFSTYAL